MWQTVEVPAVRIVFESGDEMRTAAETGFVTESGGVLAKDLVPKTVLGEQVVASVDDAGTLPYFLNDE